MNEYWIDFTGYVKIKALDEEDAKMKCIDYFFPFRNDDESKYVSNLDVEITDVEEDKGY